VKASRVFALAVSACAPVTRSAVINSGRRVGQQISRVLGQGEREVEYAFNDRGRGPRLRIGMRPREGWDSDFGPHRRPQLVAGDPATRIGDIRRTAIVIKDGIVYDAASLYRALGIR
jgi:hypothetical protein